MSFSFIYAASFLLVKGFLYIQCNTFPCGLCFQLEILGRFEVRAKLPKGSWLWPSITLTPAVESYGTWPASGEITLGEARSQDPKTIINAIRYGDPFPFDKHSATTATLDADLSDEFHSFVLQWNSTDLFWTVDSQTTRRQGLSQGFGESYPQTPAPFDKEFYLSIGLAVGGPLFTKAKYGTFDPKSVSGWTQPFQIDWVKVYQPGNATQSGDVEDQQPASPATPSLTIFPVADTYLSSIGEYQSVPFGGDALLHVHKSSVEEIALLKFYIDTDLSSMKSATLRLWALVDSNETVSLAVHSVSSGWDEATATYAAKPQMGEAVAVKALSVGSDWISIDLTEALRNLPTDRKISIALSPSPQSDTTILIQSKEATTHQPSIRINFGADD